VPTSPCCEVEFSATKTAHITSNTPKNDFEQPVAHYAVQTAMGHPHRVQAADLTQHVFNRGNNRCDIFRAPKDYSSFLGALHDAAIKYRLDLHSYTLMTNHFHLIATPRIAGALSMTMQVAGASYVRYFNRRYSRTGTLFEGPFKAMFIDSEKYWFTCMRYVELNPVRAGLVLNPADYRWSSYRGNALGIEDPLVVSHPLYLAIGATPADRQNYWRGLCREALTPDQLFEIRDTTRRGGVLGDV
jgi:putative transposase